MKYYLVKAKCGHVGNGKYVEIDFPVCSDSASTAAQYIMKRSKVKKQLKNAISSVVEITKDEYENYNNSDIVGRYLGAHSKREFNIEDYEIQAMDCHNNKEEQSKKRQERISYKLKKYKVLKEASRYEYVY